MPRVRIKRPYRMKALPDGYHYTVRLGTVTNSELRLSEIHGQYISEKRSSVEECKSEFQSLVPGQSLNWERAIDKGIISSTTLGNIDFQGFLDRASHLLEPSFDGLREIEELKEHLCALGWQTGWVSCEVSVNEKRVKDYVSNGEIITGNLYIEPSNSGGYWALSMDPRDLLFEEYASRDEAIEALKRKHRTGRTANEAAQEKRIKRLTILAILVLFPIWLLYLLGVPPL